MLEKLNPELCSKWVGFEFQLQLSEETAVSLELIEVKTLPSFIDSLPSWRKAKAHELRQEPFSLVFRGPHEPALIQRMYTLVHEQAGTVANIFLVPIDADGDGRYYEALFN